MIWETGGIVTAEPSEPAMRSCWECNGAHEHLRKVNTLHVCFNCGRYWIFDRFMDSFATDSDFDAFFAGLGLTPGDSTTKIDAGYRVAVVTMTASPQSESGEGEIGD